MGSSSLLNERAANSAPAFNSKILVLRTIQCTKTYLEHLVNTFAIRIRPAVQAELAAASAAEQRGEFYTAFLHLERAHVLGQATTAEHVRVHWRMFQLALRNRRHGEASGQLWRMLAASLFTALGWVPDGNTGGSDVSGFRRMTVPKDLQQALDAARA